ncbi:MAG: 3-hydroxybutyryl-CoA dehydrogenase [Chloroflexi bacterium]|nr:3-hydroxybutyryl-CoA dehydrogenase [Chloroflexota bacterium]
MKGQTTAIKTVGIVGAGTMGSGIAQVCADAGGYGVLLNDVSEEFVDRGYNAVTSNLDRLVSKEKIIPDRKNEILGRISKSTRLQDMEAADLVIEAAYEDLKLKKEIFASLDKVCSRDAILASNSSSLSILDMAMATQRPDRVCGVHFMNPVPLMKGVELVKTILTSQETLDQAAAFAQSLGKASWVAKDAPGFLSTRLLMPFLLDSMKLLESGFASKEDIDACVTLSFNHPMGPLTLSDLIGLDVIYNIAEAMYRDYKDPKLAAPILLQKMVAAGQLGRKTGKGFYDYGNA